VSVPDFTIDVADVPRIVDDNMSFLVQDMLQPARDQMAASPGGDPSALFPNYQLWLTSVSGAIGDGTDPGAQPDFDAISQSAFQEFELFSGIHYGCLNNPDCKDVGLQEAEAEGTDLAQVGRSLFRVFGGQPDDTLAAAADYLAAQFQITAP
jgi:hypothetical protein